MTKQEFIKQYCEGSKISPEKLRELGQVAVPCSCNYEGCQGWGMLSDKSKEAKEYYDKERVY